MKTEMTKEIYEAVTIASRYAEVNQKAIVAADSIINVRFSLFAGLIETSELQLLYRAEDVLRKIEESTSVLKAQEYIESNMKDVV